MAATLRTAPEQLQVSVWMPVSFLAYFPPWFGMGASGVMAGVFFGRDGTVWTADIIALLPVEF